MFDGRYRQLCALGCAVGVEDRLLRTLLSMLGVKGFFLDVYFSVVL
jgi:hypothetical protein